MTRFIGIIAVVAAAAAGCSRSPVIIVRNQSGLTLSNVVVAGSGFSEQVGILAPGDEHRMRVRPQADSGVRLTFEAGTQRGDSGPQGYLEARGGYRLTATIGTNLGVSVTDQTREPW
ncbi:MAG: hypothetical protein ACKO3N_07195 [Verrucomicrobiota bacterium]